MNNSFLRTLDVPGIGATDPALLFQAMGCAWRVVIHNVGGNLLFLAHTNNDLNSVAEPGDVFQLLVGKDITIVLAPGQAVMASGQGGGGLASIAASEAMPLAAAGTWGSS